MAGLLLRNARILDGSGQAPFDGSVHVEGTRIKAMAGHNAAAPSGTKEIDCNGRTLMPGLVESHGHVTFLDTAGLEALGEIYKQAA